jgi:hypothetical protein
MHFYFQAVPVANADQIILVDVVSAIKLLTLESMMQTVRQVIKQPPQQTALSSGSSMVLLLCFEAVIWHFFM